MAKKKTEERKAEISTIEKKSEKTETPRSAGSRSVSEDAPVRVSVDDVRQKMNILRKTVKAAGFKVVQDNSFPAAGGRVYMLHCVEVIKDGE